MPLAPGQRVLDRYVVERFISAGGMGEVYLARHEILEIPVALKVILSGVNDDVRSRFLREAKLMARIRHPNVVSVVDFGFIGEDAPCIAMEFIAGEPLEARARRRIALPWQEAVNLALGVLAGLDAVHAAGVLHRDLKPPNVIISSGPRVPGQQVGPPLDGVPNPSAAEVPKLIDFGIAQPSNVDATRMTQTGMMMGTPSYMAPEQLLGYPLDPRTDVYAVGMILYRILTGRLPFSDSGVASVFARVQQPPGLPVAPEACPRIPLAVGEVILSALQVDPRHRPGSARELAHRLMQAAAGKPPEPAQESLQDATRAAPQMAQMPRMAPAPPTRIERAAPAQIADQPTRAVPTGYAEAALARYRFVLGARLPASRLALREERAWLAQLAGGARKSFAIGAQLWFALGEGPTPAEAEAAVRTLAAALEARYGPTRVEWSPIEESFSITAASISGAAPLPEPMGTLVQKLLA